MLGSMHMDGAEPFAPELTGLPHAQLHTKPGETGDTSRLCCGHHWNSVLSGCFILRKSREVKLHSSLLGPHLKNFHWKSWKTRNWLGSKHICCALESTTHWAPQWGKATSSNTSASRGINISPLFLPPVHSQGKSLVLRHIFTQMTGRLEACRQLERALSDPVPEPKANNHT